MASNPFDQFDAPNPFDQFDVPQSQDEIKMALDKEFGQPAATPTQNIPNQISAPASIGRMGRVQQKKAERENINKLLEKVDAGLLSAKDFSNEDLDKLRRARIEKIPEIAGSFANLSENLKFTDAVVALTAFDPQEFGKIMQRADPNIGLVNTPEGETLAVNTEKGEIFNINKLGPSMIDALQFGGAAAMFSPAGRLKTLGGQIMGGLTTQAGIETAQDVAGGDFNPSDIALAGAAPVVMHQAAKGIRALKSKLSSNNAATNQYLDEVINGIPVKNEPNLTSSFLKESGKRATIRQAIKEGTVEGVGFKINRRGRVVSNPLERELVREGVSEKIIASKNRMTQGDKDAALEMIGKTKDYIRGVKGSETNRPNTVIGKRAMSRFNLINKERIEAGDEIAKAVERDLKNKPADISSAYDNYLDGLEKLKVIIKDDGRLDFSQSLVSADKTALKDVFQRVKPAYTSADDLHNFKQYITDKINFGGPNSSPIDKKSQDVLKELRASINETLREMSSDYASANDRFSSVIEVLKPFAKNIGKRFDPESSRVESFVGKEFRNAISNYAKADDLIMDINALDGAAKKLGGQFDDDILTQIALNAELERLFGSFAKSDFQSKVAAGTSEALSELGGTSARMARPLLNAAKDRVIFKRPSKDQLRLLTKIEKLISE